MVKTEEIFEEAESKGVEIFYGDFPAAQSVSVRNAVGVDYGLMHTRKEKVAVAYGLGSNITGGFYTGNADALTIRRADYKTRKWTYNRLLPIEELKEAIRNGYTEPWELAEQFAVPEEYMDEALKYYTEHGYFLTDADAC